MLICVIAFTLTSGQRALAQFPSDFKQFDFCENIRDIFANSCNNFVSTRRPDWQSPITIDLLKGYLTHHQEFIANNGDTERVQWDYRCELTAGKHNAARDELRLFVERLLKCDDTVKLHLVSSTEDKDSLRPDAGCPAKYSDLAVMAEILEPNSKHGGYWLHLVVCNTLKSYSYAGEKEARRQHDSVMSAAIASDKEYAVTHRAQAPDAAALCNDVAKLISNWHHDDWKPFWTTNRTDGGVTYWETNMTVAQHTVNIAVPTSGKPGYTAWCTLVRDTSTENMTALFEIVAGELESCTVAGKHPALLEKGVEAYFRSWYVAVDEHASAHVRLNARRTNNGYAFLRLDISFVTN